jgi:hypothetical protein
MRKLILLLAVAALTLPVTALAEDTTPPAPTSSDNAPGQLCKTQMTAMTLATFKLTYGTNADKSNAFGKCVAKLAVTGDTAAKNAAKQCKAEMADANFAASHEGKSFALLYGGSEKAKNAFGKCVSSQSQDAVTDVVETTLSAAKQCKAELKAGAAAFRSKYGTGLAKANAFGKCVSAKAKAAQES